MTAPWRDHEKQSDALRPAPAMFGLSATQRIEAIRKGVPATRLDELAAVLGIAKPALVQALGLQGATTRRKAARGEVLGLGASELVLGLQSLLEQADALGAKKEGPRAREFDFARWFGAWMTQPNTGLDMLTPASYLDTAEGQKLVAQSLEMILGEGGT